MSRFIDVTQSWRPPTADSTEHLTDNWPLNGFLLTLLPSAPKNEPVCTPCYHRRSMDTPHVNSAVPPEQNLFGAGRERIDSELARMGLPAFRANQVYKWLYARGVDSFDEMTDLSIALRAQLSDRFRIVKPSIAERVESSDGTIKYRLLFSDGGEAETVYIPDPPGPSPSATRHTFCVSTQVGCPLKCTFCFSGTVDFVRNLSIGEILGQFAVARKSLAFEPARSNIVFMGMGEPLLNRENVQAALRILTDPEGFAVSPRRITVSTAGLVDEIARFAEAMPNIGIAISLHATTDVLRNKIMPINRRHDVGEIIAATKRLPIPRRRRITFEYVLLKDENDSLGDADRLVALLRGLPAKVNVIAYNPWPGSPHQRPDSDRVEGFIERLASHGVTVNLRRSRGDDVLAACGQLANQSH